jgi:hypothetical protein
VHHQQYTEGLENVSALAIELRFSGTMMSGYEYCDPSISEIATPVPEFNRMTA